MSFLTYIRANYFRPILPQPKSAKRTLLWVLLWILYLPSIVLYLFDSFMVAAFCMATFIIPLAYGASQKEIPNIWRIFPLSPTRRIVYDTLGMFLFSVVSSMAVGVFVCFWSLVANTLLPALILSRPVSELIGNNYIITQLISGTWLRPTAIFLGSGLMLCSFGAGRIFVITKNPKYGYIFMAVFMVVSYAVEVVMIALGVHFFPALQEFDGVSTMLAYVPHIWIFLALYNLAGLALIAVSVVMDFKRTRYARG